MTFGKDFGNLVKRCRGIEGLTQQELAVRAFGDESSKARISQIENGHVAKPHSKTIDALIVALNISANEFNSLLNGNPHPAYVDTLIDFFDNPNSKPLYIEVAIRNDGAVFCFHDLPLSKSIKRVEYFADELTMVWVTDNQNRRPFGTRVNTAVAEHLIDQTEIQFWKIDATEKNSDHTGTYPLKIIS